MNRKQRREQKKGQERAERKKPEWKKLTVEERKEALVKNGITINDLKRNYDDGYSQGYKTASEQIVRGCYAAVCLTLNEKFGFGKARCYRALKDIDNKLLFSIDSIEMIDEVWKKTGLEIDFKEPFDRITEA